VGPICSPVLSSERARRISHQVFLECACEPHQSCSPLPNTAPSRKVFRGIVREVGFNPRGKSIHLIEVNSQSKTVKVSLAGSRTYPSRTQRAFKGLQFCRTWTPRLTRYTPAQQQPSPTSSRLLAPQRPTPALRFRGGTSTPRGCRISRRPYLTRSSPWTSSPSAIAASSASALTTSPRSARGRRAVELYSRRRQQCGNSGELRDFQRT